MSQVAITNETFVNLLNELQIPDYVPQANAQALLQVEARYIKDLKINVGNVLNNAQYLNKKEALLLALAVAVNEKFDLLKNKAYHINSYEIRRQYRQVVRQWIANPLSPSSNLGTVFKGDVVEW